MSKHTKGPWEYYQASDEGDIYIGYRDEIVCECVSPNNVHLIAAAPELLEACEYVVNYHREHDSGEGELYGLDFVTTCISAIRKAKGEE